MHTLLFLILSITLNSGGTVNANSCDDVFLKRFSTADSVILVTTDDDLDVLREKGPQLD